VSSTKFLGVQIDDKLEWSDHIGEINLSLRRFVGIFYKLSHFIPDFILKMLYFSMVHSKIIYGIEIYANTYPTYLHDLMILDNRLLRITQKKSRYSHVADLYKSFKTLPVDKLFNFRLLLHAHAILHKSNSIPPIFHNTLTLNKDVHEHDTRSQLDLHRKSYQTSSGRKITANLCSSLWNSLPSEIKNINSEEGFKKSLKSFFLSQLSSPS